MILSVINLSFTGSGITTGFGGSNTMGAAAFGINGLITLSPIMRGVWAGKDTA